MAQVRQSKPRAAQHRKPLVPLWRAPGTVACRGADLDLFYPAESADPEVREANAWKAKALCGRCLLTVTCLEEAMAEEKDGGARFGIHGGLDPEERRELQRRRTRQEKRQAAREEAASESAA
jgi:WhiB family redox-sensing transcriptional regulator